MEAPRPHPFKNFIFFLSEVVEAMWGWWSEKIMFYIKSPYLTIPKIIDFGLQCHQIIKKCSSEMYQYELVDPVYTKHQISAFFKFDNNLTRSQFHVRLEFEHVLEVAQQISKFGRIFFFSLLFQFCFYWLLFLSLHPSATKIQLCTYQSFLLLF